jgi:hypothetical protein
VGSDVTAAAFLLRCSVLGYPASMTDKAQTCDVRPPTSALL